MTKKGTISLRGEPKENGVEDKILSKLWVLEMVQPKLGNTGECPYQS